MLRFFLRAIHRHLFSACFCSLLCYSLFSVYLISIPILPSDFSTWNGEEILEDVYHSTEVFRRNYGEMERKFKIYAYEDGDYENTTYDKTPRSVHWKYASESYFFTNIRESSFLTDDPHDAHMFFIPISCHKIRQKVEYGGWGVGPVVALLCIVMLLIFLPLGMGPGPTQPPPLSILFVFPVLMAAIVVYLTFAAKSD